MIPCNYQPTIIYHFYHPNKPPFIRISTIIYQFYQLYHPVIIHHQFFIRISSIIQFYQVYHQDLIWLVVGPPLWKIWVRQLGWWHKPNISGKIKKRATSHHQPVIHLFHLLPVVSSSPSSLLDPTSSTRRGCSARRWRKSKTGHCAAAYNTTPRES